MALTNLPDFDHLPPVEGMPKGCAWGLFDQNGKKDTLGTLNILNDDIVREAAREIVVGQSVSLNWPIGAIIEPAWGRIPLTHKPIDYHKSLGLYGFDDEVHFNTQASSQWDGLCHYGHQATGQYYNGAKPTEEALKKPNSLPTIDLWHKRGGLVGRGVLLDHKAWAESHGRKYSPFERHEITPADLEAVASHQGTTFRAGDILIIRTGYTEELLTTDPKAQAEMLKGHASAGLVGNEDSARWIWNHHFAAVAGDAIGFETFPPASGGMHNIGTPPPFFTSNTTDLKAVLHQYLLAFFGMPVGELWDLKNLSIKCAELKRWTFFLTSSPLNIPGGIASPPNALAIF